MAAHIRKQDNGGKFSEEGYLKIERKKLVEKGTRLKVIKSNQCRRKVSFCLFVNVKCGKKKQPQNIQHLVYNEMIYNHLV